MNKNHFLGLALLSAILLFAGIAVVLETSDDNDAVYDNGLSVKQGSSATWTWAKVYGSSYYSDLQGLPGDMTLYTKSTASSSYLVATSKYDVSYNSSSITFTANASLATGTYYLILTILDESENETIVEEASKITVTAASSSTTNYTVSFSASPSSYGSVSKTSISVPSGTTYSKSGNNLVFKNGSTTLYTITPSAASATSSYTYSFSSWSSTSGTITADKSITANFTRTAVASYSNPVITVGSAGSTITLTSDVSVTWSISTNATKASLSNTSGTSTKVTPSNYGYIKVKATHNSDSSYYSTITLNISRVVYNANGGTGTVPSTTYWIQKDSTDHSFSLTSSSFTKSSSSSTSGGTTTTTSYTYLGWGSSSTSTSPITSLSVSYRSSSTVYAIFSTSTTTTYSAPTITVGSAGSTITLTSDFSANWSISTNPTKASLSNTSGTSTVVTPSTYGYITVKAANPNDSSKYVTKTLNICSLTYNANGGSGAPSTMYWVQTDSSAHSFTLSGTPTKSGCDFDGWGTSSTATNTVTTQSVAYRSNVTVYAVWSVSEDTLCFTSYPTAVDNVRLPTITYNDDGTYVIS